jgi:hypothetical protein
VPGFAQNFANYQSIPANAQYNPYVVSGDGSPYAQIMARMNAASPYSGLLGPTPTGGYKPYSNLVSNPSGNYLGYGEGFGGGGASEGGGGSTIGNGASVGTSGGFSGTAFGNSALGIALGAIANAIEGAAAGKGAAVGVSDLGTMSDAAAAEAAGFAAADAVGMSGMGNSGAGAADGMSAADGVGMSGMGEGGGSGGGDGGGGGGDGGGGGCVDPAVLIMLADRTYAPAGSIKVGDVLFTMHEKTQEFGAYPVVYVEELDQPKALVLFDDGSDMLVSHSHKFFMVDGEWKQVYQLEPGDTIKAAPGATDKKVIKLEPKGDGPVMKFTVEDAHTYISEGLISHNSKAKGGLITSVFGPNPPGPDDGAVNLDLGEYVIRKSAVKKYGRGLLDMINEGKVPAKKVKSLLD